MNRYEAMNEWVIVSEFRDALKTENYEKCAVLKAEIQDRIADGTLDTTLAIDGFRREDTGVVTYSEDIASLFEGVREAYPEAFTRKAETNYLMQFIDNQKAVEALNL